MKTQIEKLGFTLAEVLITLAIIGVVAVITIPTMVAGNKEKAWNTAATVFEKRLNETLKVMNIEGTLEGYTSTKDFVNQLSRHLKITKTCDNSNLTSCFEDKVFWGGGEAAPEEVDISKVKMAKNFGQKDWNTEVVGFQLNNGTTGLIAYNPDCEVDKFDANADATSCVAVLYDTTGFAQPNTSGKDLRGINIASLGGSNCAFEIGGTCYGAPFIVTTPMTYAECAGENATSAGTSTTAGAEASALGIKQCYWEEDYWAGAVKACGGTNKMPTRAQLAEIANYIYNTDKVQAQNYVSNLTMDTSKVSSLGFTLNSSNMFWIWSGEEIASDEDEFDVNAFTRAFYPTFTGTSTSRDNSYDMAVCIID